MTRSEADPANKSFTCIVIDDSDFARMNLGKIVTRIGGEVVGEAKDGQDALGLYKEHSPDIVLLDITMPVVDGLEALGNIMEHDNDASIIIVSSLGNKEMIKEALKKGAKQFITKPFQPDHVAMIIRSVAGVGEDG